MNHFNSFLSFLSRYKNVATTFSGLDGLLALRPSVRSSLVGLAAGKIVEQTFYGEVDGIKAVLIIMEKRVLPFLVNLLGLSLWLKRFRKLAAMCGLISSLRTLRRLLSLIRHQRVLRSRTLAKPIESLFGRLDIPRGVKWRESSSSVKIKRTTEYSVQFAAQFGLELSSEGYPVDSYDTVLMPRVSCCMVGDTLYLYPENRHVLQVLGSFDLVTVNSAPNTTRLPGVSIGFVGTVWGLVDNDSYARCKNMTPISVDSGFNAVTEIKSSVGRSWSDVWTMAYITEERRLARLNIPDMPVSERTRPSPMLSSIEWRECNELRDSLGIPEVGECEFEVFYFRAIELFQIGVNLIPFIKNEVEESSKEEVKSDGVSSSPVPAVPPAPASSPPVASPIVDPVRAVPADLKPQDEKLIESHSQLEINSEAQLSFVAGVITQPAVEYLFSSGELVMNPNVIKSELESAHLTFDLDEWKTSNNRKVIYGQAFGKLGYSPAPTSHVSLLTEKVRLKPIEEASKMVDLSKWNIPAYEVTVRDIRSPFFDPVPIDSIGENEADLVKRIGEMNNSKTRQRMSRTLTEFYGCQIEVLTLSRSEEKFSGSVYAKLVEVKVKVFTKGDELIMKAKPRSIKFPQSWFWLTTVLNLESQLAAIKSDRYWSWKPDLVVPFRLYWASGMTQEMLSDAWTYAISQLPAHDGTNGEYFAFICGDDNSDELGAADASAYDSTQRKFFADCQFRSMMGFESAVIRNLEKIHKGRRLGKGFTYFQKHMGNPSGSPFTLFINSLGMGLYTLERAKARLRVQSQLKRGLTSDEMNALSIEVGKAYGLEITYTPAPELGEIGCGVEFLKGVFVASDFSDLPGSVDRQPRFIWVPLPSRVVKSGKIIVDNPNTAFSNAALNNQLTSVADSYISAVVSPILSDWVEVWRKGGPPVELKTWSNVLYVSSSGFLDLGKSAVFQSKMELVFSARYGMSVAEFRLLRGEIKRWKRSFGYFAGGLWERLVLVDYLGQSFE